MKPLVIDIETLGLNPLRDKIVAIGYYYSGKTNVFVGDDEKKILQKFKGLINEVKPKVIVGYNILSFDLPFIVFRAFKNGIDLQEIWSLCILDLMHVVIKYLTRRRMKLKDICSEFGIEVYDVADGNEIPMLYELGEWNKIALHCESDVLRCAKLLKKLKPLAEHYLINKYYYRLRDDFKLNLEVD